MSCCRLWLDVVLLTSSSVSDSPLGVVCCVVVVWCCCLLGVPSMSLSIRRCVRCNCRSMSLVRVSAALPYNTVGVTVPSKSCSLDLSG